MDKTRKKQLRRYLLWIILAALVAVLAAMPILADNREEEEGPKASILTATVQNGRVEVSVRGGGILSADASKDVTLPAGVKITEFLVDNGQRVAQGDAVARVDRVSVMNAIVSVKESMDTLQSQIDSARDDTLGDTIRAAAGGRVKQVFAQPGDRVQDVMLRHGALAVLSLDGRMAVSLDCGTDLRSGDTVSVQTESAGEVEGRVESNLNGTLVITVEDTGYAVDEPVKVTDEDGKVLGTGALYIHNAWKATGYSGTVKAVYAKEETTLSKGTTLLTLKDTDYTGNLESLANLHREYEVLLQKLFAMYDTGLLTAPCDGTVSGVVEDSAFLLAGEEAGWTMQLLSETEEVLCDGKDTTGQSCKAKEHKEGCYFYCTGGENCTAKPGEHKITCLAWCVNGQHPGECTALRHRKTCIESCEGAVETCKCPARNAHKNGCIESCIATDGKKDCPATGTHKAECQERCDRTEGCFATVHHYEDCISLCTGGENCTALNHRSNCYMTGLTYKANAVRVKQAGLQELVVAADVQTVYMLTTGPQGWVLVEPASLKTDLMITERTVAVPDAGKYREGDILLFWSGYSGDTQVKSGIAVFSLGASDGQGTGGMPGMGGMGGFPGMGGFSGMGGFFGKGGMGGMSGGQSTEDTLFDLQEQVLLTVTESSAMKLVITLDQQDITKISLGQEAAVRITALRDQNFTGVVSGLGLEGTNNGGSSKFTVELTLPWQEDMLPGMNATATISLESFEDIPVIPVAALVQDREKTVVYTAQDPKTGELTAPVEVITGVADAQQVQILSGLEVGDTVYYSYYDVLELDDTAKADQGFGF